MPKVFRFPKAGAIDGRVLYILEANEGEMPEDILNTLDQQATMIADIKNNVEELTETVGTNTAAIARNHPPPPQEGDLRICNDIDGCGPDVRIGRLEVFHTFDIDKDRYDTDTVNAWNSEWGTISATDFSKESAIVACRQLGFDTTDVEWTQSNYVLDLPDHLAFLATGEPTARASPSCNYNAKGLIRRMDDDGGTMVLLEVCDGSNWISTDMLPPISIASPHEVADGVNIWMDAVICSGNEQRLIDCSFGGHWVPSEYNADIEGVAIDLNCDCRIGCGNTWSNDTCNELRNPFLPQEDFEAATRTCLCNGNCLPDGHNESRSSCSNEILSLCSDGGESCPLYGGEWKLGITIAECQRLATELPGQTDESCYCSMPFAGEYEGGDKAEEKYELYGTCENWLPEARLQDQHYQDTRPADRTCRRRFPKDGGMMYRFESGYQWGREEARKAEIGSGFRDPIRDHITALFGKVAHTSPFSWQRRERACLNKFGEHRHAMTADGLVQMHNNVVGLLGGSPPPFSTNWSHEKDVLIACYEPRAQPPINNQIINDTCEAVGSAAPPPTTAAVDDLCWAVTSAVGLSSSVEETQCCRNCESVCGNYWSWSHSQTIAGRIRCYNDCHASCNNSCCSYGCKSNIIQYAKHVAPTAHKSGGAEELFANYLNISNVGTDNADISCLDGTCSVCAPAEEGGDCCGNVQPNGCSVNAWVNVLGPDLSVDCCADCLNEDCADHPCCT